MHSPSRCVVLAGGVGGSKLVTGLSAVLNFQDLSAPSLLTVIGNTGDDVEMHGLLVSPDLDIVRYSLAEIVNPATGWGIRDDAFGVLEAIGRLGGDTWFRLGDRDLATSILRTAWRREGMRATEIAIRLCHALGIGARVIPPSDEDVRTEVKTPDGWIGFQEFFVREACRPEILDVAYRGAETCRPTPEALDAIAAADVILIGPSNPIASIGPILAVPGIREAITAASAPCVAVSPLVGGRSLKGPSDRMMRVAGYAADARGVVDYYTGLIDGIVIDSLDAHLASAITSFGVQVKVADTVMQTNSDRARLADETLTFASGLKSVTRSK